MKYFKCLLAVFLITLCNGAIGQNNAGKGIWDRLLQTEKDTTLSIAQKIQIVYELKNNFEKLKRDPDSVYARILHRIGLYEYLLNKEIPNNVCIAYTLSAVSINTSGKRNASPGFAISSYRNLASYYKTLKKYSKAIKYYDSAIILGKRLNADRESMLLSVANKNDLLFLTGDHQKCIDESTIGLNEATLNHLPSYALIFYNQRAQSYFYQSELQPAIKDLDSAFALATIEGNTYEQAGALKIKAQIEAVQKNYSQAQELFSQAIQTRLQTKDDGQLADDYIDFGVFYFNDQKNIEKAKTSYRQAAKYAIRAHDNEKLAKIYANTGELSFYNQNYKDAANWYARAFNSLGLDSSKDISSITSTTNLDIVSNTDLVLEIFDKKIQLLLALYKTTQDKAYLSGTLRNALTMDSVITTIRHQHSEEQSKLYWRNRTQHFYENAIEACYLANDAGLAFFFIEKSRAVLLADRLSELGAAAHLPPAEAANEEKLQLNIVEQQEKLAALDNSSPEYVKQQIALINGKDALERYLKSLESKYPSYYQYKYEDSVPSLRQLQTFLTRGKQSFVHYFMGDSALYILAITPSSTKLISVNKDTVNETTLSHFLKLCSDKSVLNKQYAQFAVASNSLYKKLIAPLQLSEGRIIVCPGSFMLPFDALCTDSSGRNFLLDDYSFSYVYAARYLLKEHVFVNINGHGDFLGIAPVNFAPYLHLASLLSSGQALRSTSAHYKSARLLLLNNATHHNFISHAENYAVVNVFSHARADSINEPLLYLTDSVLHLYELQLINKPAVQLMVLSACQTNVGLNATGEGIYSLARGFAATGIPSVSATLWSADEGAIYAISEKFHEYLAAGMAKDEALRHAKLEYRQEYGGEKLLPYYWANMVLMGDTEPLKLTGKQKNNFWPLELAIGVFALVGLIIIVLRRNRKIAL
ncbi:CHAT domain-containing protein [Danxiaibacter flavus]|uniref:CHAT domain-containing protein n=1 Tax=Danxiaibacter flavus TaxID=3049108 RepID=A0ABV3ZHZ1_9BACT|nr:CHAT domain-containing protein [Chitinophagaceae bacterium DXS]